MTTIFVTGDRSLNPVTAFGIVAPVVNKLITDHPEGVRFVTGDALSGIERAMRYVIPDHFIHVITRTTDAEGHTDWDASAKEAAGLADMAVVIHTDPLSSRLAKSVTKHFENVEFPLEGIINAAPDDVSSLTEESAPADSLTPEEQESIKQFMDMLAAAAEAVKEKNAEEDEKKFE